MTSDDGVGFGRRARNSASSKNRNMGAPPWPPVRHESTAVAPPPSSPLPLPQRKMYAAAITVTTTVVRRDRIGRVMTLERAGLVGRQSTRCRRRTPPPTIDPRHRNPLAFTAPLHCSSSPVQSALELLRRRRYVFYLSLAHSFCPSCLEARAHLSRYKYLYL